MSATLAIAINVVLGVGIVLAIVLHLAWGIITHRREELRRGYRRQGLDRRQTVRRVAIERRQQDRRTSGIPGHSSTSAQTA